MNRLGCALLLIAMPFAGADAQVANAEFADGMQDWAFRLDSGSGGVVDWSAATGDPAPGSAHASNVFPGNHIDGWRQCVALTGTDYILSANVASSVKTGNACRVVVRFIASPFCIDGTPIEATASVANTRNDGTFETLTASGSLPEGIQAAALSLEHLRLDVAAAGNSDCWFDHVELGSSTVFSDTFENH